jgi:8-oxo-dGTP pyrophosphatase MutT (NUDIX family)
MIEKVIALILRENDEQKEILTFKHPTAGRQLPAGTVEENEQPESALLREIKEESGLTRIEIVKKLGEAISFTKEDEFILLKPVRFYAWPVQRAARVGALFTRGTQVEMVERKAGFIRVVYKDLDYNHKPPKLISRAEGWLPAELLTHQIKRHFYLVHVLEKTKSSWTQASDLGHTYQLEWLPLEPELELFGDQAAWLKYLDM